MESEVILQDFDRVTLKDGECLVLRCRRALDAMTLERMNQHLRASCPSLMGRVLIVSNDIDIMIAAIEPESDDLAAEEVALQRMQIETAYNEGRTIYVEDFVTQERYQIHRVANPERINFTQCNYSLTPFPAGSSIAPG